MLRLKKRKDSSIVLQMESKPSFFSSTLLFSFTMALLLHLLFFFLFRVTFSFAEIDFLHPPVRVEAESVQPSERGGFSFPVLPRFATKAPLSLPPLKEVADEHPYFLSSLDPPLFDQIETALYLQEEEPTCTYMLHIELSCDLKPYKMLEAAFPIEEVQKCESATFSVLLETKTGSLFHIQGDALDPLFTKCLSLLRFEKTKEERIVPGFITLEFLPKFYD